MCISCKSIWNRQYWFSHKYMHDVHVHVRICFSSVSVCYGWQTEYKGLFRRQIHTTPCILMCMECLISKLTKCSVVQTGFKQSATAFCVLEDVNSCMHVFVLLTINGILLIAKPTKVSLNILQKWNPWLILNYMYINNIINSLNAIFGSMMLIAKRSVLLSYTQWLLCLYLFAW